MTKIGTVQTGKLLMMQWRRNKMELEENKKPNGFERNKNNWPLIIAVAGMFIVSAIWIIVKG